MIWGMKEADTQKTILDYLKFQNHWCTKIQSGAVLNAYTGTYVSMAEAGTPDILCAMKPIKVDEYLIHPIGFIEVKRPGASLGDAQVYRLRALNKQGHRWLVAESVDDVIKWFDDPKYHGADRYLFAVLDESRKFIPKPARRKSDKMSFATFHEFNRWSDEHDAR